MKCSWFIGRLGRKPFTSFGNLPWVAIPSRDEITFWPGLGLNETAGPITLKRQDVAAVYGEFGSIKLMQAIIFRRHDGSKWKYATPRPASMLTHLEALDYPVHDATIAGRESGRGGWIKMTPEEVVQQLDELGYIIDPEARATLLGRQ